MAKDQPRGAPWHKATRTAECCGTFYCTQGCLEEAKPTYHKVICGKDFSWLSKPTNKGRKAPVHTNDLDGQMWLRILATCVQSGLHPLEHPIMAGLIPNYGSPHSLPRK